MSDTVISKKDIINKQVLYQIKGEYTCTICKSIIISPMKCLQCENDFCKRCIVSPNQCPFCYTSSCKENLTLKNILNKLIIICKKCHQNIPYTEIEYHITHNCQRINTSNNNDNNNKSIFSDNKKNNNNNNSIIFKEIYNNMLDMFRNELNNIDSKFNTINDNNTKFYTNTQSLTCRLRLSNNSNSLTNNSINFQNFAISYDYYHKDLFSLTFVNILNKKGIVKIPKNKYNQKWKKFEKGINLEGICKNKDCEAFTKLVICPFNKKIFNLNENINECTCPICKKQVDILTCCFLDCEFQFKRLKKNQDNLPIRINEKFTPTEKNCITKFDHLVCGDANYIELEIKIKY